MFACLIAFDLGSIRLVSKSRRVSLEGEGDGGIDACLLAFDLGSIRLSSNVGELV